MKSINELDILIESKLSSIQENDIFGEYQENENLNEFGIFTSIVLLFLGIKIVWNLTRLFIGLNQMRKNSEADLKLSNDLFHITGKRYDIRIFDIKDSYNAFVCGGKSIFITKDLKELLTPRELIAVCLHESKHLDNKHIYSTLFIKGSLPSLIFTTLYELFNATITTVIGPIVGRMIFCFLSLFSRVVYNRTLGRLHETTADHNAVKYGYGPDLSSALQKLIDKSNEVKTKCGPLCKIINKVEQSYDEHPPLKDRIQKTAGNKLTYLYALKGDANRLTKHINKSMKDPNEEEELNG